MTDRLVFGAIADDDTGASDLAGMLAEEGIRTLLVIDLPDIDELLHWTRGYQAVVMAEGTRNLSPELARERTRAAIKLLQIRRPQQFQIKYCSTFDSTTEGNIGPSIEAAMDELDEHFTIAVPALPVNGRTTYQGYHFVHDQLLSDSPMRHHPLTPMSNSNLVAHLGQQTTRPVGLVPFPIVEAGSAAITEHFNRLRKEGVGVTIVDCLNDRHLASICEAAAELRLISGGSAFGIKMPQVWRKQGLLMQTDEACASDFSAGTHQGCLIVAGSCSSATRTQNDWFTKSGGAVIKISPDDLLLKKTDAMKLKSGLHRLLENGQNCLLTTSGDPAEVQHMQNWWTNKTGRSIPALGEAIASALAIQVEEILQGISVKGLIVAGGETSGAICRQLQFGALRVGRNIEPGVPLCYSLGKYRMPVVLKSGNFGGIDFYQRALSAIQNFRQYLLD